MAYTKEQLQQLTTQADKFGGFQSDAFKQEVNRLQGEGAYDRLTTQLQGMQSNIQNKPAQQQPVVQQQVVQQPAQQQVTQPQPIAQEPAKPVDQKAIDLKSIQSVDQWKQQTGGGMNNLSDWIESRYGTMTTQKDGKLQGNINGETFEWQLDKEGNPIRTSLGKTDALATQAETAKQNTLNRFNELLNAGATRDDINKFIRANPENLEDYKASLMQYFKSTANMEFYQKYSTMNGAQLFNEFAQGNIIIGSEKYNLLPEQTRKQFEEYKALKEKILTGDAFSYTDMNNNVVSMKDILTQVNSLFSSNIREEYETKMNSPEMTKLKEDMTGKAQEITDLDNTIKNLEDDLRDKYPGISEGRLQALLRRDSKELYRKRDDLVGSYNVLAQSYSMQKEEIQYGIELAKYEDSINRDNFKTALGIYQTERARMDAQEQRAFEVEQAELSYQRQIAMQKEMILFNEEVNKYKGGQYIDKGDGNLYYVKDGEVISSISGLGKSISQSTDGNLDFKFFENEDGSKTAFTIDKKTGKISQQTFDMNGGVAGGYLATIGSGKITSYGGIHDGGAGLDIDGKIGDPIYAPMGGEIIEVKDYGNTGYGKSVVVRMEDGKEIRMSHLNEFGVKVGDRIEKGAILGTIGNTGYVIPGKGGDGSHVDIVISENGKKWNAYQVEDYLKNVWKGEEPSQTTGFKQESIPMFTNYLQTGKIGSSAEELKQIASEFGSVENFKRQAEAYNNSPNGPRQREIDKITKLKEQIANTLSKENKGALDNSIGTIQQAWTPGTRRARENFLADIQNFLDGKTLQQLIDVKADGATFGALSNEELRMLQNSASKLNQLALREDKNDPNRITGFKGTKANFTKIVEDTVKEYEKIINRNKALQGTNNEFDSYFGTPAGADDLFDKYYR